jgi:hypothetical protein
MNCAGCRREIEVGDRYIVDSPSGFMASMGSADRDSGLDGLVADLLGGSGGKVFYCTDCTEPGGDYMFETCYGDEDDASD